jgi:ATP-dependent helicase/nuclease subunit A
VGKVQWTTDQQKVIDLRKRNILVSAAAGSGKTAVLVERIISMISEGSNPIDIDRLLIVTFTNAAAAEMRERIGKAIENKLTEQPDNSHLQKQMTLLHSAQITTIHSFCLHVIRNHFNEIDLDPGFRIGDEAELKLMRSDVMSDVLEQKYEKGEESFLAFVESYSTGKTDEGIEDIVLKLYEFSVSYPWPIEWILEQKSGFSLPDTESMEKSPWMQVLMKYLCAVVKDLVEQNQVAIKLCYDPDGPYPYVDALLEDSDWIAHLSNVSDYDSFAEHLSQIQWKRLSTKRDEAISDEKKELVKSIRDGIKKTIGDMQKNYFYQSTDEMLLDMQKVQGVMEALLDLTITFSEAYASKKEEKNIVDFNDLEHFALNILVKKENGEAVSSLVALDLSKYYEEILIDEYQDSNLVQETILKSISKEKFGEHNLFMVGDVKQSIYKFRLARPELFMEKFERYSTEDGSEQRIDLHKNFRSRAVVLSCINYIFEQIMTKELGNIEYNKEVALYPGAKFEEIEELVSTDTELILIDGQEEIEDEEQQELTEKELEARAIAKRIKELTSEETGIWVNGKNGYRRAEYRDVVILLRTMTGWSDLFAEVLMAEGISSFSDTQTGYFSALEVQTILNMLKIIDNPRQDIPFAAVLRSPMGGLTDLELASIRACNKEKGLYETAVEFLESYRKADITTGTTSDTKLGCVSGRSDGLINLNEDKVLEEDIEIYYKLNKFFAQLEKYRNMVPYTPIHSLLQYILEDTGYYQYVSVMPGGERRSGNLDMLLQRAVDFEATSYRGLFHFNRYMEKLHKYDIDFGEAGVSNENENAVRIMSIHKSKGLEFPIVFVSGLGKPFNNQDARSKLVLHPELGIGPDYIDYNLRIKTPTLLKKVIQKQIVLENLGEELRILYVAMTRAKEKLILTGNLKNREKQLAKWLERKGQQQPKMLFHSLSMAGNYLDWIVPALVNHSAWDNMLIEKPVDEQEPPFLINITTIAHMVAAEVSEQMEKMQKKEQLIHWDTSQVYEEQVREELEKRLQYQYPYDLDSIPKAKMTVTELKTLSQIIEMEEEVSDTLLEQHKMEEAYIPKFMKQEQEISRTDLGTLYHKVMEKIEFDQIHSLEDVAIQLDQLVHKRQIQQTDITFLNKAKILEFTKTELSQRIWNAKTDNKLFKEQKFVFGIPAKQVYKESDSDELVLVQGIIDAYFEEQDGLVLVDYKTDRVSDQGETSLIERYQTQLDYYQAALEQMTGKKVKERVIYSFALGKEIRL